jgi:hexosaminidase
MAPSRHVGMLALVAGCLLPSSVLALWPIPSTLETGMTALKVSSAFYFDVQVKGAPADLYEAVAQAQYYLANDKLGRLVVGRGANDTTALASAKTLSKLTLSLTSSATTESISSEAVKPLGTRSEEYALTIPADGSAATLTANSTLGLYRGLTTFNQLFYYYNGVTYTLLAPIAITDTPAYVSSYL